MPRLRLLTAVLAWAAALSFGSSASADCVAPDITISASSVAPGDRVSIAGNSWGDACNDTPGKGCNPPPLGDPIQDIRFELVHRASKETYPLTTVDANDDYAFTTTAEIPEVPPGRYEIAVVDGPGNFDGRRLRILRGE